MHNGRRRVDLMIALAILSQWLGHFERRTQWNLRTLLLLLLFCTCRINHSSVRQTNRWQAHFVVGPCHDVSCLNHFCCCCRCCRCPGQRNQNRALSSPHRVTYILEQCIEKWFSFCVFTFSRIENDLRPILWCDLDEMGHEKNHKEFRIVPCICPHVIITPIDGTLRQFSKACPHDHPAIIKCSQ